MLWSSLSNHVFSWRKASLLEEDNWRVLLDLVRIKMLIKKIHVISSCSKTSLWPLLASSGVKCQLLEYYVFWINLLLIVTRKGKNNNFVMDLRCHLECKCKMLLLRSWMNEEVKHHILLLIPNFLQNLISLSSAANSIGVKLLALTYGFQRCYVFKDNFSEGDWRGVLWRNLTVTQGFFW